ncbi:hypothetical protein PEX1_083240 [Penicillium expansum]|uniref:Uncharacterized protein n=1 Tax=Penicillium expansum TaxID=27334 RepID=A0A0A2HYW9_PENEN|nr:hypothetical protein PEX2_059830 [Penicillium expansum]KGO36167.1 hypothetical protein PEXP_075020 [Penicillium expansum]KGO52977.1 hypothetical protein PEX1_083240 [Penicillium expansum]KGO53351.1 hypothetical protein PEX2_059830 [Penicillium expansum]
MHYKSDIAGIVSHCLQLFKDCLSEDLEDDILTILEDQQRCLWRWANSLKVFAGPPVNLDAQLRQATSDNTREMVLLLLDVLKDNLIITNKPKNIETGELIDWKKKENAEEFMVGQESKKFVLREDDFKVPFFGIDGSLERLEKLATAILEVTEASVHRRVYAYQAKNQDKRLERDVYLYLLGEFPNLVPNHAHRKSMLFALGKAKSSDEDRSPQDFQAIFRSSWIPGLFRALSNSVLFRHYRIMYEQERRLKGPNHHISTKGSPRLAERTLDPGLRREHTRQAQPSLSPRAPTIQNYTPSKSTKALTIDESNFDGRIKTAKYHHLAGTPSDGAYSVLESGHDIYPNPPQLPEGATEGVCTLCRQSLPASNFEGNQWSAHIEQDIKPYVCISENCEQIPSYFVKIQEWKVHMQTIHTPQWIRYIHNPLSWKCPEPECHSTSTIEFASEKEAQESLINHMKQEHFELDEDELHHLASVSIIPKPRAVDICPICGDDHKPKNPSQQSSDNFESKNSTHRATPQSQVARKGKVAIFDVPGASGSEDDTDSVDNPTRRAQPRPLGSRGPQGNDHSRIETHIGRHLSNMAFHFSSRLIKIQGEHSNALQEPGADSTAQRGFQRVHTEQDKEQLVCIEANREQLGGEWEGDRRPTEDLEKTTLVLPQVEVKNKHKAIVRRLLEAESGDFGMKNINGLPLISWAALNGYEAVVKRLLDTGKVDPDVKDNLGRTPLWRAASGGHEAVVKRLLDTGKVDPDVTDNLRRTPLYLAVIGGHEAVVKRLLGTGKVNPDRKDNLGRTPLWRAASGGHEAVVKRLLDTGKVDPDAKDNLGRTPLCLAVSGGHEAVVKRLLDTGKVDPHVKDDLGQTPLYLAVSGGHEAVVKRLLDTGKVDPHAKDDLGQTPLCLAASGGYEAVVKQLLDTGKVDPDAKDDLGRTPLCWAASRGHKAAFKRLLDTGKVDPDVKDDLGQTPLCWAASEGHEAIFKRLLDTEKVDPDVKDNLGRTPLYWAASGGYEAVVKLLLDTGKVDPDAKDNLGRTPLWRAASGGHEAVVKRLLGTSKVNPDIEDRFGRTPLLDSTQHGHHSIANLIKKEPRKKKKSLVY